MLNWPAVKDDTSPTGLDKISKFEMKLMTVLIIMTLLARMGRFYNYFINHVCNLIKMCAQNRKRALVSFDYFLF